MAEIKQQSISELSTQLNQAIIDGNYALVESTARTIRKLQQAEHQAKLEANAAKIDGLIETIKTSKDLARLVKDWLKQAKELIGEVACIGFEVDPTQGNLINAWVQSRKQKRTQSNSPGGESIAKGMPKTHELMSIYGESQAKVRWDKAEHSGTFNELYEAAKNAVDRKNATHNVRLAIAKYHKSQS
jgi:hypothetical protein